MSNVFDAMLSDSDSDGEEVEATMEDHDEDAEASGSDEGESDGSSSEDEAEEGEELEGIVQEPEEIKPVSSTTTFKDLGLSTWLIQQLNALKLTHPTPVQAHCIPKVLEGSDVLGCAKTGTGKTLAFSLPILNKLAVDPYGVFAVILTPTRELAYQIADQCSALGRPISLKVSIVIGGRSLIDQAAELTKRPHIVVATPGRLCDHIESDENVIGKVFSKLQFLVLDEADRMLDGQYNDQLKVIFNAMPKKRQTLLFSATITSAINQLHKVSVRKPYFFEDKSDVATVDKLDQKYVLCPVSVKDAYLVYVVKNFCERNTKSSVIVFAQTCRECQALANMFKGLGFEVGSLHSMVAQRARLATLASFRSKTLRVLICTDVAARGLDITHVDLVVNHNVPQCPKTYVHRVGRSARAGRYGSALTFVTQYDVVLLQAVEELIGKKLEQLKVNDKQVSKYVTKVLVSKREAELQLEQQNFGEKKLINKRKDLMMAGMTEEEADQYLEDMKTKKRTATKRKPMDKSPSKANSSSDVKLKKKKLKA